MPFQTRKSMMKRALFGLLLLVTTAPAALAAVSPQYEEWRQGPVKWIMASDEEKAWRNVKTDDEALAFVNLFWARRDPTPGTAVNEFRAEFEGRVRWADENFIDTRTVGNKVAGSLSERGRVYILLGNPTFSGTEGARTTAQAGGSTTGDPTANRQLGNREHWRWEGEDARKFGIPRIEVVFIHEPSTRRVTRDPSRPDFLRAEPNAIRKAIVNPDLKEVPEWAASTGLESAPVASLTIAPAQPRPQSPVPADEPDELPAEEPMVDEGPVEAASTTGASRLTLVRGGTPVKANAPANPLEGLSSESTFGVKEKLEWVAQYCSATPKVPDVEVLVGISGPFGGESQDRVTPPKKVKLARLNAVPGCYLVRGAAPLKGFAPGRYLVRVMFEDMTNAESYDLERNFTVQ